MIDLDTGEIADLWKDNTEPEFLAISYALKMAMSRLKAYIDSSQIFAGIQNLQEDAVDELAVELSARGYDQSMPIEVKRNMVASALLYYTYAGTAKAIRALIQGLYGDAEVDEWFDYGGDPYHFRVGINITDQLQTVPMLTTDELGAILKGVSRTSAHLDDVSFVIRPVLLIGQETSLYLISPAQCGTVTCGEYPESSIAGYSYSGILTAGNAFEAVTQDPDPAGTLPEYAIAGYSQETALVSTAAQTAETVDPVQAASSNSGTYPAAVIAGAYYTGTVALAAGSVETAVTDAQAGTTSSQGE